MAANINYDARTGTYRFVSTEPVWHKLGQTVQGAMTARECIINSGLDYRVDKIQNYTILKDGTKLLAPDNFSTVNMDVPIVLGNVGKVYEVVQNVEAFDFFTEFAGEEAVMFETAGALGNGETVFISAKIPNILRVGKKDEIQEYLLLVNYHDGSGKIKLMFTPIRVVCNNTLNQALTKHSMQVEIKHTTNVKDRLKQAHELMGIHKITMSNQSDMFNLLYNTPVTDKFAINLIRSEILTSAELKLVAFANDRYENVEEISTKKKNVITDMEAYLYEGFGQSEIAGTAWWVLNGVTGYYQHVKSYKSNDAKFDSITRGTAYKASNSISKALLNYAVV